MIRRAGHVMLAVLTLATSQAIRAEPSFAVRTGDACSKCHTGITGGGMRSGHGSFWSQTSLARRAWTKEEGGILYPSFAEGRFSVGADLRAQYLYVHADGDDTSSFEIPEASVYGNVELAVDRLSLYLDETVGPGGASAREIYALWKFARGWNAYAKAGRILPPFGWRIPEDDAFIRQSTGYTFSAPDTGIEVGAEPGRWSLALAMTNGTSATSDDDRSKRASLSAFWRFPKWRIGVSGSNDIADGIRTSAVGLSGGWKIGQISLLGEIDGVRAEGEPSDVGRLAARIEGNWLVTRGVLLKLSRDWLDPDRDVDTEEQIRDSLGVEYFPAPFVQLRLFVRRRDGPPQVPGTQDEQVDLELHVFF
jgi:hypothetical protein